MYIFIKQECLSVPELLPQFWDHLRQTFSGTFWGPSRWSKVGGRFHKYLNTIMILTFDLYEAAPDLEVNTIMGSAETFAGLRISR